MRTASVVVLPYDEAWRTEFDKIKAELEACLGDFAIAIEHVGSTSVAGMSAKPCIDIDVVIADRAVLGTVISKLSCVGYIHEGDLGISGREAFEYSEKPHLMKHHLYVCAQDCAELKRHLAFRDFLLDNPDAVKKYSAIKETAAQLFPNDIDKYIEYKSPCIEELYRQCGLIERA